MLIEEHRRRRVLAVEGRNAHGGWLRRPRIVVAVTAVVCHAGACRGASEIGEVRLLGI